MAVSFDRMSPDELYNLNIHSQGQVEVLWRAVERTPSVVIFPSFPENVLVTFSETAATNLTSDTHITIAHDATPTAATPTDGTAPISMATKRFTITGGTQEAITRMLNTILKCCNGGGMVNPLAHKVFPVLTAMDDRKAAKILGMPKLTVYFSKFIDLRLMPGRLVPVREVEEKLKGLKQGDQDFERLVDYVAGKTWEAMQLKYEQEQAAKRLTSSGNSNTTTAAQVDTAITASSNPETPSTLPTNIFNPLRCSNVAFGTAVNAVINASLEVAYAQKAEDRCRARARAQARAQARARAADARDRETRMIHTTLRCEEGPKIGKQKAFKIDLAQAGVTRNDFTGGR